MHHASHHKHNSSLPQFINSAEVAWHIKMIVICIVTICAMVALEMLLRKWQKRLKRDTTDQWSRIALTAMHTPLRGMIFILGIGVILQVLYEETHISLLLSISALREPVIMLVAAIASISLIRELEQEAIKRNVRRKDGVNRSSIEIIARIAMVIVAIIFSLLILQSLGISITGVLAFGGIGTLAVGFAGREMLANVFGSVMLYLDRPFAVDDYISSPDKSIEGTVEYIGWRVTCIRKADKSPLYVPNAVFSSIIVENISRMTHRLIVETIKLRYQDIKRITLITSEIEAMLRASEVVDANEIVYAKIQSFSASAIEIQIYCCIKITDYEAYMGVKQDLLLKIHEILRTHQADVAPITTNIVQPST